MNRPGIKARFPRRSVQHGTGNPNSMAAGEAIYLYNGAEGRQASYHMSIDDRECWVMVPFDEVTWQGADGSGPGNMNGVANEMIENATLWANPARANRCIDNNAEMMGIVAARFAITRPEQHWDFNYMNHPSERHDCPNKLRYYEGAWERYTNGWYRHKAAELARMTGGQPVDARFAKGDTVRVTAALNIRRAPTAGGALLATLEAGTELTVIGGPQSADGYSWYDVEVSPAWGTGWVADVALEKVATPAPAPVPEPVKYVAPVPIPALLETDLGKYDTATGIVTDEGTDFIFTADVIEAVRDTPCLAWAAEGAPETSPAFKKGERKIGAWLVKAANGEWYYISPAPEWERIAYADTRRVADAPLLGNERDLVGERARKTLEEIVMI